ncbi:unnamed protein product [Ranitomeya imitator]|uniref:RING-type E3 ubiquitin transferase n=1 Tax=Ranitomeya imitator TaxID=111125 RepID=A0ABN9L1H2_9NEOB|nr:unnamed protein product [Ranitomeya imitator]
MAQCDPNIGSNSAMLQCFLGVQLSVKIGSSSGSLTHPIDGNQGKHRVTKRGPALSYPMFTLVTSKDIAESASFCFRCDFHIAQTCYLPQKSSCSSCDFRQLQTLKHGNQGKHRYYTAFYGRTKSQHAAFVTVLRKKYANESLWKHEKYGLHTDKQCDLREIRSAVREKSRVDQKRSLHSVDVTSAEAAESPAGAICDNSMPVKNGTVHNRQETVEDLHTFMQDLNCNSFNIRLTYNYHPRTIAFLDIKLMSTDLYWKETSHAIAEKPRGLIAFCVCSHGILAWSYPVSFAMQWLRNPGPQHEKRTLFGDMVCFLFITPLATISGWLCLRGAVDHLHFSSRLEAVGLIALTVALFTIYLFWTLDRQSTPAPEPQHEDKTRTSSYEDERPRTGPRHPSDRIALGPPLGYIGGLSIALQNAVAKPLKAAAYIRKSSAGAVPAVSTLVRPLALTSLSPPADKLRHLEEVSFRYHCRLYNEWRRTNQRVILVIPKSINLPSNQQSLLGLHSLKRNSKETIV